ncbi:tripartite tricarboxylate transporter TctB family protein [Pseudooceanicola sp. CBS1P-1]|uniref:DUF1468 domain-containing protein n=1 Tax=Pseudooceanicola albus TaxID=2692189 RepID=A0A6L7G9V6_9RHOB|nr:MULTISPECIES: tripartite tricarboxylate transporter TctB family protein [Pseudooceanicola]MBT9386258.1 tripartite tricarboxylate transporter TctB family protein [Pseudooceanicola endophyticus]MXN20308.1 hypothetical protein [Pseudooceanicola albus]
MQRIDQLTSLVLVAVGLIVIAMTSRITYTSFTDDPGPRLFPYLGAAVLILSGLSIFVKACRDKPGSAIPVDRALMLRGAMLFALMGLYALAMKLVGFYPATPVAVFALYWMIAGASRRLWRGIVLGLATTLFIYLLFTLGLQSYLPEASLF